MKTNRDQMGRFLLLCGVFAPIMMMIVIFVLGQITPNYNPISDSVCQMGTPDKPYAIVLNAGYIAYGILMSAAAYGLFAVRRLHALSQLARDPDHTGQRSRRDDGSEPRIAVCQRVAT